MKLRTEREFNDRVSKLKAQDPKFVQIVKKYIPQIKNYIKELNELHDAIDDFGELWHIQDDYSNNEIGFPGGENHTLFGCFVYDRYNKYNKGVFINVVNETIVFGKYEYSVSEPEFHDWIEYKLDDIESICEDDDAKRYSEKGELIKDLV